MATAKKNAARTRVAVKTAPVVDDAKAKPPVTEEGSGEEDEGEDLVIMQVTQGFILTLDNGTEVPYGVAVHHDVPRAHAEHWYSKAHGVKIIE